MDVTTVATSRQALHGEDTIGSRVTCQMPVFRPASAVKTALARLPATDRDSVGSGPENPAAWPWQSNNGCGTLTVLQAAGNGAVQQFIPWRLDLDPDVEVWRITLQ